MNSITHLNLFIMGWEISNFKPDSDCHIKHETVTLSWLRRGWGGPPPHPHKGMGAGWGEGEDWIKVENNANSVEPNELKLDWAGLSLPIINDPRTMKQILNVFLVNYNSCDLSQI